MTLRHKTLIIVGLMFFSLIVILFFLSRGILMSGFADLEYRNTRQNVDRALSGLYAEIASLKADAADWSAWDDTYAFIENANSAYIKSNLVDDTFINLRLNLILFIDSSGKTVYAKAFDLSAEKESAVPRSLNEHLTADSPLIKHIDIDSGGISGILALPEDSMLVSSQPILTSTGEGPARGTLIMGRYLGATEIKQLSDLTHLSLAVHRFADSQVSPDFNSVQASLSHDNPILIRPLSEETIAGYALVKDIYGKPGLILRADMPRDIYEQGRSSVSYLVFATTIVAFEFGIVTILILELQVLSKLFRLNKSVGSIGVSGSSSARVPVEGKDELANLADTINRMLSAVQQSENKLRESEAFSNILLESAPNPMLVAEEGVIRYVNPALEELTGFSKEELVGKNIPYPWWPSDYVGKYETDYKKVIAEKNLFRLERIFQKKSGVQFWVDVTSINVKGDRQTALHVSNWVDITARKQMEEALRSAAQKWRNTFNAIGDAVCLTDTEGRVIQCNQAFSNFLGKPSTELVNHDYWELIHSGRNDTEISPVVRLRSTHTRESQTLQVDGRWFDSVADPVLDEAGNIIGAVFIMSDVTERKRSAEELQQLYKLEKELRHKLEEEAARRVEFTRALVHELKTPLTPVLASSELLVDELKEETPLRLAKNVHYGAAELNRRIDELLDLAKGEIGMLTLNLQEIAPLKLLEEVVSNMTPVASAKKLSLLSHLPSSLPVIVADGDRVRQVLLNLIGNAIKFTSGGVITLSAMEDGDNLVVEIQDTGRGIDEEEQKNLFQPYHRRVSDRERLSGLGLGLALSKKLVELHGGKIWVNSKKGVGSTFTFSLPVKGGGQSESTESGESNYEGLDYRG